VLAELLESVMADAIAKDREILPDSLTEALTPRSASADPSFLTTTAVRARDASEPRGGALAADYEASKLVDATLTPRARSVTSEGRGRVYWFVAGGAAALAAVAGLSVVIARANGRERRVNAPVVHAAMVETHAEAHADAAVMVTGQETDAQRSAPERVVQRHRGRATRAQRHRVRTRSGLVDDEF
jgi:hypothetical protein